MNAEQEKALREYLQEAIVPLIEQVLVKKLGQAMSFAAEQLIQPKREWLAQPEQEQDSTCNNTLRAQGKGYPRTCSKCGFGPCIADRVQPAQQPRQWQGLTEEEFFELLHFDGRLDHVETPLIADFIRTIQAKLKEKNHDQ